MSLHQSLLIEFGRLDYPPPCRPRIRLSSWTRPMGEIAFGTIAPWPRNHDEWCRNHHLSYTNLLLVLWLPSSTRKPSLSRGIGGSQLRLRRKGNVAQSWAFGQLLAAFVISSRRCESSPRLEMGFLSRGGGRPNISRTGPAFLLR